MSRNRFRSHSHELGEDVSRNGVIENLGQTALLERPIFTPHQVDLIKHLKNDEITRGFKLAERFLQEIAAFKQHAATRLPHAHLVSADLSPQQQVRHLWFDSVLGVPPVAFQTLQTRHASRLIMHKLWGSSEAFAAKALPVSDPTSQAWELQIPHFEGVTIERETQLWQPIDTELVHPEGTPTKVRTQYGVSDVVGKAVGYNYRLAI